MRFVKMPDIFSTVADLSCIRKRIFNGTGSSNKIFEKNAFWQCINFSWYFLYNFMKLPEWLVWKCFKQCINICFVSIVYSLMLSISKITYFKWKMITAVLNVNGGVYLNHGLQNFFFKGRINYYATDRGLDIRNVIFSGYVAFCRNEQICCKYIIGFGTQAVVWTLKNNALSKIPILYVAYHFLKWTSFRTIWWYLLFYGSIVCMNTITQPRVSCLLHSHHFATNIF